MQPQDLIYAFPSCISAVRQSLLPLPKSYSKHFGEDSSAWTGALRSTSLYTTKIISNKLMHFVPHTAIWNLSVPCPPPFHCLDSIMNKLCYSQKSRERPELYFRNNVHQLQINQKLLSLRGAYRYENISYMKWKTYFQFLCTDSFWQTG